MCLSLRTLAVSVPSLSLCHLLFPSLSLPVLLSWALSLHFNPCCLSDFLSLFTFSVSGFLSLSTTSLCRFFSLILRLSLPLHLFCVSRLGYGVSAGGGLRVGTDRFQAPSLCTLSPEVVLGWVGYFSGGAMKWGTDILNLLLPFLERRKNILEHVPTCQVCAV